jgi:hypothetical protein
MNVSRTARRLATAGVATALATGALVGGAASTATAATGSSTYTCNFPMIGETQLPVEATIPTISAAFPTIPAGLPIDMGSLQATYVFDASPALVQLLPAVSGLGSSNMTMLLGDNVVSVPDFAFGAPVDAADGHKSIPASGTNGAFSVPGGGVYDLTMPKSFTLTGTSALGPVSVPCTTDSPAVLDTLTVVKNDSINSLKAPASVKKGKVAKLVATVAGGVNTATGKVVFMDGKKKLGSKSLNDAGRAVFKAKGLKVGKHNISFKYAGDAFRNKGKSTVSVVKVVK